MIRKYYAVKSATRIPCYNFSDFNSEAEFQDVLCSFNTLWTTKSMVELTEEQYMVLTGEVKKCANY